MSKFKVGDKVSVVHAGSGVGKECIGKIVTITEIGGYVSSIGYKVHPPIGNTLSGDYKGFIGERSFELVEDGTVKGKFKIGDRVYLKSSSRWFGQGTANPHTEDIVGTVRMRDDDDGKYDVEWDEGYTNGAYTDECLGLAEEKETMAITDIKSMYTHTCDGEIVCGSTTVEVAKRKRDGQQQYIIRYGNSNVKNGAVKHSDIPALVAALLDIYDEDVKEQEIPF